MENLIRWGNRGWIRRNENMEVKSRTKERTKGRSEKHLLENDLS